MEHITNHILLRGSLQNLPEFSHENHGRRFFRFFLEVPRLSGAVDILPVIAEQRILDAMDLSGGEMLTIEGHIRSHNIHIDGRRHLLIFVFAISMIAEDGEPLNDCILDDIDPSGGDMLTVRGQVRSHNIRIDGKRHLLIFVFASSILAEDGEPINDCILDGPICREPTYRRTPLGREICDVMLAVPRAFRRADYLPCILWGRIAQEAALCHTRDQLRICGRLQSRSYTKLTENGPEERIAYEISALSADIPSDLL